MIDREILDNIGHVLLGTCLSIERALETSDVDSIDIDIDTIEDKLLDVNIERCKGCSWWFESCELVDDEHEDDETIGYCRDCKAKQ